MGLFDFFKRITTMRSYQEPTYRQRFSPLRAFHLFLAQRGVPPEVYRVWEQRVYAFLIVLSLIALVIWAQYRESLPPKDPIAPVAPTGPTASTPAAPSMIIDKNNDGIISAVEWTSAKEALNGELGRLEQAFQEESYRRAARLIDRNRDGVFSASEWYAGMAEFDANRNGELEKSELMALSQAKDLELAPEIQLPKSTKEPATATLQQEAYDLDVNQDGKVTYEEVAQFAEHWKRPEDPTRIDPVRKASVDLTESNRKLRIMDKNGNGKVFARERYAYLRQFDKDGDGELSPDELAEYDSSVRVEWEGEAPWVSRPR